MTSDTTDDTVGIDRRGPWATVTLNRPEVHNAFNDAVIARLRQAFEELGDDNEVRVVVLAGTGKSFSAGADLHWMRSMVDYSFEENVRDAQALAKMFETIDRCPKVVIARVHGAAIGGGAGLVAVADIAVSVDKARFAFSEARLGIIPAVIAPYVLRRIGVKAREYFLTGSRFGADCAANIGLVDHVVSADDLDAEIERLGNQVLRAGPGAVSAAKALIRDVTRIDPAQVSDLTAKRIAERRASPEGQEGMRAFLEKRPPKWAPPESKS